MIPIDPVCGMQVDGREAVGTAEYCGKTYPFCSQACLDQLRRNPEQFAQLPPKDGETDPHRHA